MKDQAWLFREAARVVEMCEGTGVKWWKCVRGANTKVVFDGTPMFNVDPDGYEFALALVEGKPVFVGDELYLPNGEKVVAGKDCTSVIGASASWNPPKSATVMVELLREDVEGLANYGYNYRVEKACRKALKGEQAK